MNKQISTKRKGIGGISLIALVVTIIVLLILAGVSVAALVGENGIINNAKNAQQEAEINSEKEMIEISVLNAMRKNRYGNIEKETLEKFLNDDIGENKTEVYNNGDTVVTKIIDSERYYEINQQGEIIGPIEVVFDATPGEYDGKGTLENPFVIMSIEDLMCFSKKVYGATTYKGTYIELGKTLDFESDLSYINPNTTEYDEFLGGDGTTPLKEQLTKGLGFKPIGKPNMWGFEGYFDGKNHVIKNVKVDKADMAGLFITIKNATIQNLGVEGNMKSTQYSGGIVSRISNTGNEVKIINCYFKGNVNGGIFVGGIVGETLNGATVNIENCRNYGNVICTGTGSGGGGIIGQVTLSTVTIRNSYNSGEIIYTSEGDYPHVGVGGIIGINYNNATVTIENSYNKGNLKLEGTPVDGSFRGIGGMVGYINKASTIIINSVNLGNMEAEGPNIGGLIGRAQDISTVTTKLDKCYYKNDTVEMSVGSGITEELAIGKNEESIKTQKFVDELNLNIKNGFTNVDTKGWAQWILDKDKYPILDFLTIWNGDDWEKN